MALTFGEVIHMTIPRHNFSCDKLRRGLIYFNFLNICNVAPLNFPLRHAFFCFEESLLITIVELHPISNKI